MMKTTHGAAGASTTAVTTEQFLELIWPDQGTYFVAEQFEGRSMKRRACRTISEAAQLAIEIDSRRNNAYHACAVFKDETSSTGKNVRAAKALWVDIDCGAEKAKNGTGYRTQEEALEAVEKFCQAAGLPEPLLVNSGNGIHVYWPFEDEVDADTWRLAANRLKAITDLPEYRLLADGSVTADIARILRPVGTHNLKDKDAPKLVHIIQPGTVSKFESLDRTLVALLPETRQRILPAAANDNFPDSRTQIGEEWENTLKDALAHIDPDVERPEWWKILAAIAQVLGEPGRDIADQWSQGAYHDKQATKYNEAELNKQFDDALSRSGEAGPRVGIPTILKAAEANGWVNPQQNASWPPPGFQSRSGKAIEPDWALRGDTRNADFFANVNQDRLIFVHEHKKWLRWDTERWQWCNQGEEIEVAKAVARAMVLHAAQLEMDSAILGRLLNELALVQNEAKLRAMLSLAGSDPRIATSVIKLDADPLLLGVRNGVLDLEAGVLTPNTPGLRVTKQCEASFHPDAQCPRWLKFMDEVFNGDQATIDAVQRLLGVSLTGLKDEEFIVFCVGHGANGKSIFGNVVSAIFGDYAKSCPSSLLAARRSDDHGPRGDLADLKGTRLASVNELPGGMQLDETVTKQLAGRELITARHLYGEHFAFQPGFTPWVRTNHRPIIKGTDNGIWRRIKIIRFGRTFELHEQDPDLERKLLAERDGILAWMAQGAHDYLNAGDPRILESSTMAREVTQYRAESDLFGEFLEDETVIDAGSEVERGVLWTRWVFWAEEHGLQKGSMRAFTEKLSERGVSERKSGAKRFYTGIKLSSPTGLGRSSG